MKFLAAQGVGLTLLFCVRLCSAEAGAGPLNPEPVSADTPEVRALLARGPVLQRVGPDAASVLGKPAAGLLDQEILLTVQPKNGQAVTVRGRFDAKRDTFLLRAAGLPADTVCSYTLTIGGKTIGPFPFVTAPANGDLKTPFRVGFYGDSCTNTGMHRRVSEEMLHQRPRLVLHAGDLATDGRVREQWDAELMIPARNLLAAVDLRPCYGNHDRRSVFLANLFDLPASDRYYSFDYGCLRVIVLDLYQDYGPGSPQYRWLEAQNCKPHSGWTVAVFHEPPFGVAAGRGFREHVISLVPVLEQRGVHLALNGHDHHYVRSKPIADQAGARGIVYLTAGGGGQTLYDFSGFMPHVVFARKVHHYVILDVSAEKIAGTAYDVEGKQMDSFVIEKEAIPKDTMVREFLMAQHEFAKTFDAAMQEQAVVIERPENGLEERLRLALRSPFSASLSGKLHWRSPNAAWTVEPAEATLALEPGAVQNWNFQLRLKPQSPVFPAPALVLDAQCGRQGDFSAIATLRVQLRPFARAFRIPDSPKLDGELSEKVWKEAAPLEVFWKEDASGPPRSATEVRAAAAPDALYFGVRCALPAKPEPRALAAERDSDAVLEDDSLCFYLDWQENRKDYRLFALSLSGQVLDSQGQDRAWNGAWSATVKRGAAEWTAEVRIPWSDFDLKAPPRAGRRFGFNLLRAARQAPTAGNAEGEVERSVWIPSGGPPNQPKKFGYLLFE